MGVPSSGYPTGVIRQSGRSGRRNCKRPGQRHAGPGTGASPAGLEFARRRSMRNPGRLLALAAICAAALWAASAPASALTVSVGGDQPTVPLPLPLPVGATASVGDGGPLQVGVQAPASTERLRAGRTLRTAGERHGREPTAARRARGNGPRTAAAPRPSPAPTPVSAEPRARQRVDGRRAGAGRVARRTGARCGDRADTRHATTPGARLGAAVRRVPRDQLGASRRGQRRVRGDRVDRVESARPASSPHCRGSAPACCCGSRSPARVLALRLFVGSATSRATRAG